MLTPETDTAVGLPFLSSAEAWSLEILVAHWSNVAAEFDDEAIAELFGLPLEVVSRFRRHQTAGPRPRATSDSPISERRAAVEVIPCGFFPVTQELLRGYLNVPFRLPRYLCREPLRYDLFTFVVERLETDLELDHDLLASAFGVDIEDIAAAISAWRAHADGTGHRCPRCRSGIDPRFSEFCSTRCQLGDARRPRRRP